MKGVQILMFAGPASAPVEVFADFFEPPQPLTANDSASSRLSVRSTRDIVSPPVW